MIRRRGLAMIVPVAAVLLVTAAFPAPGQERTTITIERESDAEEAVVHEIIAVPYEDGDTTGIGFRGTHRHPEASAEARVERQAGATEIEIELDEMKPAHLFGGDFNTYVFWAASPEGDIDNLGEFMLDGDRAKLNVTTPMDTFAMFITAEPHFMVDHPSRFIVLQNVELKDDVDGPARAAKVRFTPYEGHYEFDRETLTGAEEAEGEVRTVLNQAVVAVKLAREARADLLAPKEMAEAEAALNRAQGAASAEDADDEAIERLARDAVRAADAAEDIALEKISREARR